MYPMIRVCIPLIWFLLSISFYFSPLGWIIRGTAEQSASDNYHQYATSWVLICSFSRILFCTVITSVQMSLEGLDVPHVLVCLVLQPHCLFQTLSFFHPSYSPLPSAAWYLRSSFSAETFPFGNFSPIYQHLHSCAYSINLSCVPKLS